MLTVVQVGGGLLFGSLALLADSAHQLVDVAALALALVAGRLATRPARGRNTYGWRRADVLGAQASAVLLLASSVWIAVEAADRLSDAPDINGPGVAVLGVAGLAVNGGSAWWLARVGGGGLNLRAAVAHLLADAAGSAGVLVAGLAMAVAGAAWVDGAVSAAIAVAVAVAAVVLLRDTTRILLEAAPAGVDLAAIEATLLAGADVKAVHHLHVWALGSDEPALSAHVVLDDATSLHDAQLRGDTLKLELSTRFGIDHATLELECHACDESAGTA
ncbi:cation diffusion facilitator family transporter [soil metagenome]